MSNKTLCIDDRIYEYLTSVSLREPELLRQLRHETAEDEMSQMQIAPEQGQFMALLLHLIGARKTIEIGVYTGYSALCTALALPDEGRMVACDVSEQWTNIARKYWRKAGVMHKIDLRLAPAAETLDRLSDTEGEGTYDFAFIDADKSSYDKYYEQCLRLIRPGGVIAIDNVLWNGDVADTTVDDADTVAIRDLNDKIHHDPRVEMSLVPIADGLTLVRRLY